MVAGNLRSRPPLNQQTSNWAGLDGFHDLGFVLSSGRSQASRTQASRSQASRSQASRS
jgi:hypothetical protein